jgi:cytochrome c-type biogenesis protein CcmH/NrfG
MREMPLSITHFTDVILGGPMAKTSKKLSKTVEKSTLYGVAIICLAAGFLGGIVFSIYKSGGSTVSPQAPAQTDVGDRSRELEALTKETAQNPKNTNAWIELGNLYFDTNQFDKSIWAYEKALEIDPKNPNVWTDMGVMYRRSNQPQEAIKAFDEAIKVDPQHEIARFNKGIVLLHDLNDPERGIQAWEDLLSINPLAMAPNGKSVDELVAIYKKNLEDAK